MVLQHFLTDRDERMIVVIPFQFTNQQLDIEREINIIAFKNLQNMQKNYVLPIGVYELSDLESLIKKRIGYSMFHLKVNKNTLKYFISCYNAIDFTRADSKAEL